MKETKCKNFNIGGLVPVTSIDYPGELSAVVFCQGCMWQCPYCHNKHLRQQKLNKKYNWDSVKTFLESRKNLLSAVVFSGGEPIMQNDLPVVLQQVKSMGFKIGLHTTGYDSIRFAEALELCDWVGFDIKHFLDERYDRVTGISNSSEEVEKSLELLIDSGKPCELRITRDSELIDDQDLLQIQDYLSTKFSKILKVQKVIRRE